VKSSNENWGEFEGTFLQRLVQYFIALLVISVVSVILFFTVLLFSGHEVAAVLAGADYIYLLLCITLRIRPVTFSTFTKDE
jgi:hypothetical protein